MSKLDQNDDYDKFEEFEEEESVDWSKYIELFIQNWKRIFIVSCIVGVFGIIMALCMQRKYKVEVVLAPEIQSPTRSGSLSSLASMFGMNIMNLSATSADAFNITIFPEIVGSTPFLSQLFNVELSPMPKKKDLPDDIVEARKIVEGPLPTVKLYDHLTGRDKEPGWFSEMIESVFGPEEEDPDYLRVNSSHLTKEQFLVAEFMRKHVVLVDVDQKTAMATITVQMDDPLMCAQLADTVCRRLRDYVYKYRTEKEQQNFEYYSALCDSTYKKMTEAQAAYAAFIDNNHSVVLQSVAVRRERLQQEASMASQIYQQMVQQRELSRAQLQESKPMFAIVEPSTFPQRSTNSRVRLVLMYGFLGFFFSCVWYLFAKDFYNENWPKLKNMLFPKQ